MNFLANPILYAYVEDTILGLITSFNKQVKMSPKALNWLAQNHTEMTYYYTRFKKKKS